MIRSAGLSFLPGALARRLMAADDKATKPPIPAGKPATAVSVALLSQQDDAFLDELEKANHLFFWEQAHPETGLVKDRCNTRATDTGVVASIAGHRV